MNTAHPALGAPTEPVRSLLAVAVVMGGGALLTSMWWWQGSRPPTGFVGAVVAMMSGVLGYYFGTQGIDHAHRLAAHETGHRARIEAGAWRADEAAASYDRAFEALIRRLSQADAIVEELAGDPAVKPKIDAITRRMEVEDP